MTKIRTSNLVVNTALTDSTDTNLTGLLKGNAGKVAVATPDTDYATPTSVGQKVSKASNLSDLANRQTALNNLAGAGAGNESKVLAQDPADGNIKLMAATSGGTGGGMTYDFVLNENITAGNIVQLLTNGKIEKITSSSIAESIPAGTSAIFRATGNIESSSIAYDPFNADKFVIAYRNGTTDWYGKVVIGTISGSTVTFGTTYTFSSATVASVNVCFDKINANKLSIAYLDANSYLTVIGASVSGSALTFGSVSILVYAAISNLSLDSDPFNSGVYLVACNYSSNGYVFRYTVTGTLITQQTPSSAAFLYSAVGSTKIIFSSTSQNVFMVAYTGGGNYPCAIVGTIGASSITFGAPITLESLSCVEVNASRVPGLTDTFVVTYFDSSYTTSKAKGISFVGTALTAGTAVVINAANTQYIAIGAYPLASNRKFIIAYYDGGNSGKGTVMVGTMAATGLTITLGSEIVYTNNVALRTSIAFDYANPGKFTIAYRDNTANDARAIVGQLAEVITNLSSTKLAGVLKETGTTNQTKPVTVMGGIDASRSGLTPNSLYYIQSDGSVSTSNPAGSVLLGRAISTTAILTKQNF